METFPNLGRAMIGGLAGTVAMTAMMYGVAPMMGLNMDIAGMLGSMLGGSWAAGLAMHFVNGSILFPAAFAYARSPRVPGAPVLTGMAWGAALWLVAQTIVMPMMGAGLFSSAMGGMMAAAASLVGHLVYGSVLGAVAGATERRVVRA